MILKISREARFPKVLLLPILASLIGILIAADGSGNAAEVSDTVWYDAESGEFKPVEFSDLRDQTINRQSRWTAKPKQSKPSPTAVKTSTTGSDLSWGTVISWVFLLTALAIIGFAVFRFLARFEPVGATSPQHSGRTLPPGEPDEQMIERILQLAPELQRTDVNLRSEAERLMTQNQLDAAIILLLGHQLILLDRTGWLRLARGKTNGRYVLETRGCNTAAAEVLARTAGGFDRSYFGHHSITAAEFKELWLANEQLEDVIEKQHRAAA